MFNCLLTTNCFYAFAPQLSSFRSLSGISMLGFYIAFGNRPFGLVTRDFRFHGSSPLFRYFLHRYCWICICFFIPFIGIKECLELSVRFELTTFRLQGECSAIELWKHLRDFLPRVISDEPAHGMYGIFYSHFLCLLPYNMHKLTEFATFTKNFSKFFFLQLSAFILLTLIFYYIIILSKTTNLFVCCYSN